MKIKYDSNGGIIVKLVLNKKVICMTITLLMLFSNFVYAKNIINKDESVFTTLNQDGSVKEEIVSNWIHVDGDVKVVKDVSVLKDIVNLKGNEIPDINDDKITWTLNGNDIFYQGTTNKSLPLEVKIKYFLSGKEIKPKALVGKSGKVKISIEFKNKDIHKVSINGKNRSIYRQYTTVALLDLPLETFKNVKVNSGQVISDGSNQIVAFVAFPGLSESLNLKENIINIPEGIVINCDATKFKLGSIMIAATPMLPDIKKFNEAKTLDELTSGVKQLTTASKSLADGAAKLSKGQKLFVINIGSLNNALSTLSNGSQELKNGMVKVDEGAMNLGEAASKVSAGVKSLSDNALKLGQGAKDLGKGVVEFATNASTYADGAAQAVAGIGEVATKTGDLSKGLSQLAAATATIKEGENNLSLGAADALKGIDELKLGKQKELETIGLLSNGIDGLKKLTTALGQVALPKDLSDKLMNGLDQEASGLSGLKDGGEKFVAGLDRLQDGITNIKNGADKLNQGLDNLKSAQEDAASGAAKLSAAGNGLTPVAEKLKNGAAGLLQGAKTLSDGGVNLSDNAGAFSDGSKVLVDGSNKLSDGMATLEQGTSNLVDASTKLTVGLKTAATGTKKLLQGATELSKGSTTLSDNLQKFNQEGVKKLNDKINKGMSVINDLLDIKNEIVKLSKGYKTFSGASSDMEGKVKFIFKTDEIK